MEDLFAEEFDLEQMEAETEAMLALNYLDRSNSTFHRTEGGFVSLDTQEKHYNRVQVFRKPCPAPGMADHFRPGQFRQDVRHILGRGEAVAQHQNPHGAPPCLVSVRVCAKGSRRQCSGQRSISPLPDLLISPYPAGAAAARSGRHRFSH